MTEIIYTDYSVKFSGHAERTEVCTAISTLMFTLIHNIEVLQAQDKIKAAITDRSNKEEAKAFIECIPKESAAEETKTVFRTVLNGLWALSTQFPDCLTVIRRHDI